MRKQKKQKLEEHWGMLKWLMKYVEENIYAWERRREVEKDEQEMNEIFEE